MKRAFSHERYGRAEELPGADAPFDEELDDLLAEIGEAQDPVDEERAADVWRSIQNDLPKAAVSKARRGLKLARRCLDIAACLVVIAAIAAPIAMAHNEWFRSVVYRLVLRDAGGGIEARLEADPASSFTVPAAWEGLYYPAAMPDSFHVSAVNGGSSLELMDDAQRLLILEEHLPQDAAWIDTAGKQIGKITAGGMEAYLIEGTNERTIILPLDDRLMILSSSSLTKDELIGIAAGVRRIVREDSR